LRFHAEKRQTETDRQTNRGENQTPVTAVGVGKYWTYGISAFRHTNDVVQPSTLSGTVKWESV